MFVCLFVRALFSPNLLVLGTTVQALKLRQARQKLSGVEVLAGIESEKGADVKTAPRDPGPHGLQGEQTPLGTLELPGGAQRAEGAPVLCRNDLASGERVLGRNRGLTALHLQWCHA